MIDPEDKPSRSPSQHEPTLPSSPSNSSVIANAIGGFFVGIITTISCVTLIIMAGSSLFAGRFSLTEVLVSIAVLAFVGFIIYQLVRQAGGSQLPSQTKRAYRLSFLIGSGVGLLLIGLCFGAIKRI